MISLRRWAQRNCITHFGVIGEPLQMLSPPTHLFIGLAGAGGGQKVAAKV